VYGDLVALDEPGTSVLATLAEDVAAVAPTTTTAPADGPAALPSGAVQPDFGRIREDFDHAARTRAQPVRVAQFLDALNAQEPGERPGFHFLHVVLPHNPFKLLPGGRQYALPDLDDALPGLDPALVWDADPWPALAARQRHLLQLRAVDEFVGEVLSELRDLDLYDRSLVVVTADHGAGFIPGDGFRQITDRNAAQVAWVPFVVKRPGERDRAVVDDRNVETIDLLPTIADVLDIEVPWPIDGRSAFGPPRADGVKVFRTAPFWPNSADDYREVVLDARTGLATVLASPLLAADPDGVDAAIFRTAPHGELIGRPVAAAAVGARDGRRVVLDDRGAFDAVNLAEPLPAFVRGHLEGGNGDETVVFAVNGTVAGVSPTFDDRDEPARFTLLVPPSLFRAGRNDVTAFLLTDEGGRVELAPVATG
jgi:hypothetical protein